MSKEDYSRTSIMAMLFAWLILATNIYFYEVSFFSSMGWTHPVVARLMLSFNSAGFFDSRYRLKIWAEVIAMLAHICAVHKNLEMGWRDILIIFFAGLILYFLPITAPVVYGLCSLIGFILLNIGIALCARKSFGMDEVWSEMDTFPQGNRLMRNKLSINFNYVYQWHGTHKSHINVVSPNRAVLCCGTPGAGKSYTIIEEFIRQEIHKDFAMFVYDFKFPALSKIAYNQYLFRKEARESRSKLMFWKTPEKRKYNMEFCVLNFNDVRYSQRCNPIAKRYINSPADTTEFADLIMKSINKAAIEKEDFFSMSATMFLDLIIYWLSIYKGGIYCTFPHIIEMMSQPYKKIFEIMEGYPEMQSKLTAFVDAMKDKAMEQLQGQLASARIPLGKFSSPEIYWVLSADDFSLRINDKKSPKILVVGNNPTRQNTYATAMALVITTMFKEINQPGRQKCGVIIDELPTVFIKGLPNLIATARSNDVCILLAVQDRTQLIADYGDKEANKIFATVGNRLYGQVLDKTAEDMAKAMGKIKVIEKSISSGDSTSVSKSYRDRERMPIDRIENLSQAEFFGNVADKYGQEIKQKMFAGKIIIDTAKRAEEEARYVDMPRFYDFEADEIERRILEDKHGQEEYIYQFCYETASRTLLNTNPDYNEEQLDYEINKMIESLTAETRANIIRDEITAQQEKRFNEILTNNYHRIREEVVKIVEDEYGPIEAQKVAEENKKKNESRGKKINEFLERMNASGANNANNANNA